MVTDACVRVSSETVRPAAAPERDPGMRLHLDALPADVLFSIASRHVPSLAALVSASKTLRIALLPCLEACVYQVCSAFR